MAAEIPEIHQHMLRLALGALTHANWHANYYSPDNDCWSELSVLQAAHACEIFIKARIAQEHPLLIFEQLPKGSPDEAPLSLQKLIEGGRTYQFVDLPDRLWATTGIRLPGLDRYRSFGKLRNTIQHFTAPSAVDASEEAIRFIYEVIDPFIHQCWGLYAIDFNEDSERYIYLIEGLIRRKICFIVSPDATTSLKYMNLAWPEDDGLYRAKMEARFGSAAEAAAK